MRVIAGTARSLPLKTPEGMDTRPTTDRIKETLFNMLQTYIPDCVFVDIFSGSGGIGIEALSRGARKAYFIENAPKALACIEDNLAFTKMKDRAIVLKQDACAGLTGIYEKHVDVDLHGSTLRSGAGAQSLRAAALCQICLRRDSDPGRSLSAYRFLLCGRLRVCK